MRHLPAGNFHYYTFHRSLSIDLVILKLLRNSQQRVGCQGLWAVVDISVVRSPLGIDRFSIERSQRSYSLSVCSFYLTRKLTQGQGLVY